MAPNVKEANDALLSLADLSPLVLTTSKYAPLTLEVADTTPSADGLQQQPEADEPRAAIGAGGRGE